MYTHNNDAGTVNVDKEALLITDIINPPRFTGEGFLLCFISVRSFHPGVFPDPLRLEVQLRPLFPNLQDPAAAGVQEVLLPVQVSDSEELHWVKV